MTSTRLDLAHVLACAVLAGTAAGCADSHGRELDDAGRSRDAGPVSTDAPWLPDGHTLDGHIGHDAARPPSGCDAQDARSETCPDVLCDGPGTWHWQGERCVWIDCGACVGEDCGTSWSSEGECEAAHATCDAALCRATDGEWRWWAEECGHLECGVPPPVDCIVGQPVCDCGPRARFEPGVGCVDAECPIFEPGSREALCARTGGAWSGICCDTVCGEYCPLACASPACDCGPGRVMDDALGCIESAECFERSEGESCGGAARCEGGTICCESCGGAGCSGRPVCALPTCDADPLIDECGNRLDAP